MTRRAFAVLAVSVLFLTTLGVAVSMGQSSQSGGTPPAAPNGPHPVAVIDLVRVFNECAQIQDLNEQIKQKTGELEKEAEQRRSVIEQKQIELTAFQPGKSDYESRRKELMRLNVEANVWFKMAEEDLEREKFTWTQYIYEESAKKAGEVATEKGYDVVLQRAPFKPKEIEQSVQALRRMIQDRTVLYNVPEIDITDIVIRRLDAAYRAGGGTKPGPMLPVP